MGIKSFFVKPSTEAFYREANKIAAFSWFDRIHSYVYGRWTYLYIGIGTGQHPVAKKLAPILDGETVVDLDLQIGYLHRGLEKECESGSWYQCIPYTDRLNYNSAILANLGFCMAVEKLLGLEAPERCQWLRVMAGELSRLGDHLTRSGAACLELQAMTPFLYGIEAREPTWDLQEMLCGARAPRTTSASAA